MVIERKEQDTTPASALAAYEAIVSLGDSGNLAETAAKMRQDFQRRTGAFGPEDTWFETRVRAFWDDALTTQGFGCLPNAQNQLDASAQAMADCMTTSHRGFFVVHEVDDRGAVLLDVWSGAELIIRHLDESQALTLEHALSGRSGMDARVTRTPSGSDLFLLPGAYHHSADALEPAIDVLIAAQKRGMETHHALDALMRMELVLRSSSRVKASFAYRVENLGRIP